MRRQNPPQSYLDKAQDLEKFLRASVIASIYAMVGILYFALIAAIFLLLVYASVLNLTVTVITIFAVVAIIPTVLAFLAYFLRPNDPVSLYIKNLVSLWHRPIKVSPHICIFNTPLKDGELLSVTISFYFPVKDQTLLVKERLYTYVHGTLVNDCAQRIATPTGQEIEQLVDPPMETLASELNIPVFYVDVEHIHNSREDIQAPTQYWGTGTLG